MRRSDLIRALQRAVADSAAELEEAVRANAEAAVGPGALTRSIRQTVSPENLSARIDVMAEHAPFIEFGTLALPARPFLAPAVETMRRQLKVRVSSVFRQTKRRQP